MIYFIQAIDGGPIKIGYATNPQKRLAEIQRMSPVQLRILKIIDGTRKQEKELHKHFARFRLHGEWFNPDKKILEIYAPLSKRAEPKSRQGFKIAIDRAGFTVKQIAEALQFDEKTIRRWIKDFNIETIPSIGQGTHYLVLPSTLRELGIRLES